MPCYDLFTIELSDRTEYSRTEYSAYDECYRHDTILKGQLTREDLLIMSFSQFVETVSRKWITTKKIDAKVTDERRNVNFAQQTNSGH